MRHRITALATGLGIVLALILGTLFPPAVGAQDNLLGGRLLAQDAPWHITARKISYDASGERLEAEGDVLVTQKGQSLFAQKASYDLTLQTVSLSGNIVAKLNGDLLTGDEGFFDLARKTGRIINGRLFLKANHFYMGGSLIEKTGLDTYRIDHCLVTSCDGPDPDWSITGTEVAVTIEGYGEIRHAAFRVRDTPVLYFPYLLFPAKIKRQTGLLVPSAGYSSLNGGDFEIPFFWALSDQADATFYQRYMTHRGYMQGLEFRYIESAVSKGMLSFNILSDRIDTKNLKDADQVKVSPYARTNATRYWLRAKADQEWAFDIDTRLDLDYVSDQDYLREFEEGLYGFDFRPAMANEFRRPVEDIYSSLRTSRLRAALDRENYSLQGDLAYSQPQPSDPDTPQPLTGLSFNYTPRRLASTPLYLSVLSDYDYVWRDEGTKGQRVGLTPELRLPLWLGEYVGFEPFANYSLNNNWYREDNGASTSQLKTAYEGGSALFLNAERVYAVSLGEATRLRHRMSPVLRYRYRSEQDPDKASPWFEPIDVEGDRNRLSFTLENALDARLEDQKGRVRYRQWGTLDLIQGYDLDEARRETAPGENNEPFTPLTLDLKVNPTSSLDLRSQLDWDHYEDRFTRTTFSLDCYFNRSEGRRDMLSIDYIYRPNLTETLNLEAEVNLVAGFGVGGSIYRDINQDDTIASRYWLRYRSQCYGVKFLLDRSESQTRVGFMVELLGLGEAGTGTTW